MEGRRCYIDDESIHRERRPQQEGNHSAQQQNAAANQCPQPLFFFALNMEHHGAAHCQRPQHQQHTGNYDRIFTRGVNILLGAIAGLCHGLISGFIFNLLLRGEVGLIFGIALCFFGIEIGDTATGDGGMLKCDLCLTQERGDFAIGYGKAKFRIRIAFRL